ncbi:hypothetical protein [Neptunicella sp. SCSIO 80796]|uniref:hypothetical protein n=1 Tax=Neptunicella plasticusilytica TaxID=3117012 RepID=UPI003A4E15F6
MQFNSIKYRLVLIISVCVIGMLVLVISQIHYTNQLIKLNQQNKLLLHLNADLLQLRRHEKDFLLRHDKQYVEQFQQRAEQFELNMRQLSDDAAIFFPTQAIFNDIQTGFPVYRDQFLKLVGIHLQIGLNENSGFQKQFRDAIHELEEMFDANNLNRFQVMLLQIRRHEKDFMLRRRMEYVDKEQAMYHQLEQAIAHYSGANQSRLKALLNNYQNSFMQLVEAYQQVGLDHNDGMQGDFRQQAHLVEEQLAIVDQKLAPMIAEREQQVKRNGLLIAGLTSLALIILLIRSFITFQRAFSDFVIFFYRCKREYQRMDEKKLGFAEFKSLAAVANEMVEARRDMEVRLQHANEQLQKLSQEQRVKTGS